MVELPKELSVKASQQFGDLELIHRSQAGDTEAFGELVTKYRAKIFSMIRRIVGNENDAWDLAQEGFVAGIVTNVGVRMTSKITRLFGLNLGIWSEMG
jgi:hypothetical protein